MRAIKKGGVGFVRRQRVRQREATAGTGQRSVPTSVSLDPTRRLPSLRSTRSGGAGREVHHSHSAAVRCILSRRAGGS